MNPTLFGKLPHGESVEAYDLSHPDGSRARIITLGGIITSLRVPDRDGEIADIVLGFDNLSDYLKPHPYFGAIAGRVLTKPPPIRSTTPMSPTCFTSTLSATKRIYASVPKKRSIWG